MSDIKISDENVYGADTFKIKPQKMELYFHECINGEVIGKLIESDDGQLTFTGNA